MRAKRALAWISARVRNAHVLATRARKVSSGLAELCRPRLWLRPRAHGSFVPVPLRGLRDETRTRIRPTRRRVPSGSARALTWPAKLSSRAHKHTRRAVTYRRTVFSLLQCSGSATARVQPQVGKTQPSDPPPRAAARHRGAASGVEGPGRAQRQRREHDRPRTDASVRSNPISLRPSRTHLA
jgi:hypothetical protein